MSWARDGGPAFPTAACPNGSYGPGDGMTLRDYFAAKAMQSYIAHLSGSGSLGISRHYDEAACESYLIADAMLRIRGEA